MKGPELLTGEECRALTTLLMLDALEPKPMPLSDKIAIGSVIALSMAIGLGTGVAILAPPVIIAWKFAFWCFS